MKKIEISKITKNNPDGGEDRETFTSPCRGEKWTEDEMVSAYAENHECQETDVLLVEDLKTHASYRVTV